MKFSVLSSSSSCPVVFYDGEERQSFPFEFLKDGKKIELDINPLAPECWNWRHYYSDAELNEIWKILDLKFKFLMSQEVLVDPIYGRKIYVHPFHVDGGELSVCYTYNEVSNGHFLLWLVGVLWRPIPEYDYAARIESILKCWHKGG